MQERIAVIGLGYVGLPVALAFARKFPGAVGFDVNKEKVDELRRGYDRNQEVPEDVLKASSLKITSDLADLKGVTHSLPLGQMLLHVVNHGTQHRSEVAMLLTELGHSPGDLDFHLFLLQRQS